MFASTTAPTTSPQVRASAGASAVSLCVLTCTLFEPPSALAWESRNALIHTFHVWQLVPTSNGCTVVDEECQRGLLPWAARAIQRRALHRVHQEWLADLAVRAGPPIALN